MSEIDHIKELELQIKRLHIMMTNRLKTEDLNTTGLWSFTQTPTIGNYKIDSGLRQTVKSNSLEFNPSFTGSLDSFPVFPNSFFDSSVISHSAVSNDGKIILLTYVDSDNVLISRRSTNYGKTWSFSFITGPVTVTSEIIGCKICRDSTFQFILVKDTSNNNGLYLYISSNSGSSFNCTGQICSGYFPKSFDCSDNGNYITILMYNTGSINSFCSYNRGLSYIQKEILAVEDESIQSVTPIKLSNSGKVQQFFVSFNSEEPSKIIRCDFKSINNVNDGNFSSLLSFEQIDISTNYEIFQILNGSINEYGNMAILIYESDELLYVATFHFHEEDLYGQSEYNGEIIIPTNFTCITFSDNLQNVFVAYENGSLAYSFTFGRTFNYIDFFESGEIPIKLTYSSDSSTLNMLTRTSTKSLFATIRVNINTSIKKTTYISGRYLPIINDYYQYTVKPDDSIIYVDIRATNSFNKISIVIPYPILSSFIGKELYIRHNICEDAPIDDGAPIRITSTLNVKFYNDSLGSSTYYEINTFYGSVTLTTDGSKIFYK